MSDRFARPFHNLDCGTGFYAAKGRSSSAASRSLPEALFRKRASARLFVSRGPTRRQSAGALQNGDHSDRADVRFARPNIQNLRRALSRRGPMGLCAVFRGVKRAETKAAQLSYCLAHHVRVAGPNRSLMIASIRYLDQFVKTDGRWYFRRRKLMVDWIDNRPLGTG
jgi:hypothetical protein